MRTWRESTWWWLACIVAALVAEVIYATNHQYGNLQGHAFGLLTVVSGPTAPTDGCDHRAARPRSGTATPEARDGMPQHRNVR